VVAQQLSQIVRTQLHVAILLPLLLWAAPLKRISEDAITLELKDLADIQIHEPEGTVHLENVCRNPKGSQFASTAKL
jgi:hypothetical protein